MYLKSLKIATDTKVIREIPFRPGINLIIDETPITSGKETGNNVGKTTVLMLIDFCLGGEAKSIYTDPENKREEYKLVKDFLFNNKVLITLVLKDDLLIPNSKEIKIERNFLQRSQSIRRIDGVDKTIPEFEEELTDILFPGHYGKKPSFRQIISHNIRYKDQSINNTLKTLDAYTRNEEYETLYLFLLGCDFSQGDIKQDLLSKIRIEKSYKDRLEKEQTKSAYESSLSILDAEIQDLNARKLSLNMNENFEKDLNQLNQTKYQINVLSSEISHLELRRSLINEAVTDIKASNFEIDVNQLKVIYNQALERIYGIQRSFEELYAFHSRMIEEKVNYISKELPEIEQVLASKQAHLNRLLADRRTLTKAISQSESFEELEEMILIINEKHRKKGEYETVIQQLSEVESNLLNLEKQLNEIDDALFSQEFETKIQDQLNKFNKHFAAISQELYGEKYALKVDATKNKKGQRIYKFSAFNTNFSSGKKQGEISCFDIAYTLFADEENIPCFHFLLNDKKELMHDNQLLKIAELVNNSNIQFIASILKDKLPDELNHEDFFIVKLSQSDKLFRIEDF